MLETLKLSVLSWMLVNFILVQKFSKNNTIQQLPEILIFFCSGSGAYVHTQIINYLNCGGIISCKCVVQINLSLYLCLLLHPIAYFLSE